MKGVLRNFAKFTGKHLCQSLFFNKVAGLKPLAFTSEFFEIFKNTYGDSFYCRSCRSKTRKDYNHAFLLDVSGLDFGYNIDQTIKRNTSETEITRQYSDFMFSLYFCHISCPRFIWIGRYSCLERGAFNHLKTFQMQSFADAPQNKCS